MAVATTSDSTAPPSQSMDKSPPPPPSPPQQTTESSSPAPLTGSPPSGGSLDPLESSSSSPNRSNQLDMQVLMEDFNCALQENFILQGHMYLFIHHICFYSNLFGFETKKVIPFDEVTSVKRAKTAGIFPTAIELVAADKKYFFTSFLSRDEAIKLIEDGWVEHGSGSKAMSDQQDLRSELIDEEPEIVDAEDSDEVIPPDDEPETTLRNTGDTRPKQFNRSPKIEIEVSVTPSSVQDAVDEDTVVVQNTDCSSSGKALPWEVEDADAPDVPDGFTLAAEATFPIKVDEFFSLFFSDDALPFLESYHKKCGDKDLKCTTWKPHDQLGYAREVSFQHPIKIYFGARFGSCNEVQNFRVYKNSHLVVRTSQEINDVPYGDYFRVEGLWDVVADSNGGCTLKVYVNVAFSKKTMWKEESATPEQLRNITPGEGRDCYSRYSSHNPGMYPYQGQRPKDDLRCPPLRQLHFSGYAFKLFCVFQSQNRSGICLFLLAFVIASDAGDKTNAS
ncbi:GRAM-like protein [Artemisia annua]|uniref:GRAM-like protein n=1 Tax=Artemisia annua TaxID=35608 RepID=A0A2U1PNF8_ARTAN|nr:GRAM-like protein [Artemisia annua]